MKTIYFSMTTHPNMNYDRSLRSVIWEAFPKLYRLYLHYLRDNPPLKSHMQLPPQTLLSLKQCAPDVLELAQALHAEGRLRFMGTFFSESIAQCQDEMSVIDAAELGCALAAQELDATLEGFFLQEIAYTPQLPHLINRLGVQWTIIRDWDDSLRPFWAEGLDGSRCVAVPMLEAEQRRRILEDPGALPDNALLITHCDMEIPVAIRRMHELEQVLRERHGFETKWCFVSDYLQQVGVAGVKRPTPCTNKPEDTAASPSFSRWCSDHLSMQLHEVTLRAMETRRVAALAVGGLARAAVCAPTQPAAASWARPYTTWEVENPWLYPELCRLFGDGSDALHRRLAMLIAWGCNSDGRGWYPLLERRHERTDSLQEAELVATDLLRQCLRTRSSTTPGGRAWAAVNAHGVAVRHWQTLLLPERLALVDAAGRDAVQGVRRQGAQWEHLVRLEVPAYTATVLRAEPSLREEERPVGGCCCVGDETGQLTFRDGVLRFARANEPEISIGLGTFRIQVKCLDHALRDPVPEGGWRVSAVAAESPRLVVSRQLDYHIHFRGEYTLDAGRIFADWRFWFTYPTLVDALDDFDCGGPKTDFSPGGLSAEISCGGRGSAWYDVPFGVVQHPRQEPSYVAPLTHAFLDRAGGGGVAVVSQSGSQSFRVDAGAGTLGLCMGKSTTSGGRRKLLFRVGDRIDDYSTETEWYKEFFYGELRHRFVIQPFAGDWRDCALPSRCRALAQGPQLVEATGVDPVQEAFAELEPETVRLAGFEPDTGRVVLCEMCGRETDYCLRIGDRTATGRLGAFGIAVLGEAAKTPVG